MITSTQELLRAQKHIDNQEYDAARKILLQLDDPAASEWLAELDKIAPVKPREEAVTCGVLLRLFFTGLALFPLFFISIDLAKYVHLTNAGLSVNGQVIRRYSASGVRGRTYYLAYTYEVNGHTYTDDRLHVPYDFYNNHSENTDVIVLYDPNNPSTSTIQGSEQSIQWVIGFPLLGSFLIYLLYDLFRYYRANTTIS